MKHILTVIVLTINLSILSSFSQCSNGQKLDKKPPMEFGDIYFTRQPQAVRDLQSAMTLFIPIKGETNIELDSVYFRKYSAKLKKSPKDQNLYLGQFTIKPRYSEDMILSSEVAEEHQNKLPKIQTKIPFELKPNECVISFKKDGMTRYYKISNIKEIRSKGFPMAPRNNH